MSKPTKGPWEIELARQLRKVRLARNCIEEGFFAKEEITLICKWLGFDDTGFRDTSSQGKLKDFLLSEIYWKERLTPKKLGLQTRNHNESKGGNMEYTKKKWKIEPCPCGCKLFLVSPIIGCQCGSLTKVDACLVAAAPDLLYACKELLSLYDMKPSKEAIAVRVDITKQAIKKAEGNG